jgi:hypothetical protein
MTQARKAGAGLWIAIVTATVAGASCSASKTTTTSGPGSTSSANGVGGASATGGQGGSSSDLTVGVGNGAGGMTSVNGTTTTSGAGGGDAPADACTVCAEAGGTCTNGVCVIVDEVGQLDPTTKDGLEKGGKADPAFRFVYPYDKTVFARGLLPPTLQFEGTKADAVLVTIQAASYSYKGWFGGSNPVRVPLPAKAWEAMTLAAGAKDPVKVSVTKIAGDKVTGPINETWTIAQGSLKGTIYYETYDSPLAGGPASVGIMRLDPGQLQPTVVKKGCGNTCHTASADGSTLVSATGFVLNSVSYDLKKGAATMKVQPDQSFTYGGLYPDGSLLMSSTHYRTWSGLPSRLYDPKTGTQLPAPTWSNIITNGGTPAFSPDGKAIVFNHEDTGKGHTIATMAFTPKGLVFSNLQDIATHPDRFLGWPAFTPDTKRVIYQAGTKENFETNDGAKGDLFMVSPTTKKAQRLDALNGYAGNGTYLPANDPDLNFAPTILPVAVGGYFWVIFTSHRSYGNTLPSLDNNGTNGKLWVSAIDIDATDGIDASHPAFYLEGQELKANNLRGVWVLAPCKEVGQGCKTGDECCGGYCYEVDGKVQCQPKPDGCAQEFEKCTSAADCCDPGAECINGFCAIPAPK